MNHDIGHSTQSSSQSFGAISSNDFNCTSKFTLTGGAAKKAFAVQTGLIIVQDVGNNRVNIALKPLSGLGKGKPTVGLYVYRGVLKSSFVDSSTGNIVAFSQSGKTEFVTSIWSAYSDYHSNTNGPLNPSVIGMNSTLANTVTLESIFNGSQSASAHIVTEGICLGDWDDVSDIGFEVLQNTLDFNPDIGFLKQSAHTISVSGISNPLEKKAKREECLLFLDPASLYGLHYYDGVTARDAALADSTYSNQPEFYEDIVDHFATRNRLYIDVRSEYGCSYNFYGNYHDGSSNNIKLGNSTTTPVAQSYTTSDWPYVYTDSCPTSGTTSDVLLAFRLAEGTSMDNPRPMMFYAGDIDHDKAWKIVGDDALTNSGVNTDWTESVSVKFPNYDDSGTKKNVAWYMRLHYARQEPYTGSNTNVPKLETNAHLAWGPIREGLVGSTNTLPNRLQEPMPRLFYGENDGESFSYIGFNEISWSDTAVVFNTASVFPTKENGSEILQKYIIGPAQRLVDELRKSQLFYSFFDESNIEYSGISARLLKGKSTSIADRRSGYLAQMAMSVSEFDDVKGRSGLSGFHQKFITSREQLSPTSTAEHTYTSGSDSITHYVRNLDVSGLDGSSAYKSGTFSGGEVQAFSLTQSQNTIGTSDGVSNAYQQQVGEGDPRVEDVYLNGSGQATVSINIHFYGSGVGPGKSINPNNLDLLAMSLKAQWDRAALNFLAKGAVTTKKDEFKISELRFAFSCSIITDEEAKTQIEHNKVISNKYFRVESGLGNAMIAPGEKDQEVRKGSSGRLDTSALKHTVPANELFVTIDPNQTPIYTAKQNAKFTSLSHELCHGFGLVRPSDNQGKVRGLSDEKVKKYFVDERHPIPSYYEGAAIYLLEDDGLRIMIPKGSKQKLSSGSKPIPIDNKTRFMQPIDIKQMHLEELEFVDADDGGYWGKLGGISRRYYKSANKAEYEDF